MRKIQLCSGGLAIPGWESFDMDMDIRKPLRFPNESAQFIHCEHGIEHITHQEAWNFLHECKRVLVRGGTLRLAFPDICKMREMFSIGGSPADNYRMIASTEGTREGAIKAAIFNHGHQAAWCTELMVTFLDCAGFAAVSFHLPMESSNRELVEIEQHWKSVGHEINDFETTVIEAIK